MKGTLDSLKKLGSKVWRKLVEAVDEPNQNLIAYELALQHPTAKNKRGIVRYTVPPDFKTKAVVTVIYLTPDRQDYMGLFVGKGGSGVEGIVKRSGCDKIEVSDKTPRPHIYIQGSTLERLQNANSLVKKRLAWAQELSNKNGRKTTPKKKL
mmetsp:Transcript_19633/g.29809  ORF Transcript_19633/g.29809 Transcript_19633/m.29809 type:complete len:152 (+) Transcript_19633:208-663(+)